LSYALNEEQRLQLFGNRKEENILTYERGSKKRRIEHLQSEVRCNFYSSLNICDCHDDELKKNVRVIKRG
jgi:hypothetical protein